MVERETRHPLELLSARIDGEIEPSEARFLRAHVDRCPECQKKDVGLRIAAEGLGRIEVPAPADGAIERLVARLREQAGPIAAAPIESATAGETESASRPTRARHRLALGAATIVALCAVGYLGVRGRSLKTAGSRDLGPRAMPVANGRPDVRAAEWRDDRAPSASLGSELPLPLAPAEQDAKSLPAETVAPAPEEHRGRVVGEEPPSRQNAAARRSSPPEPPRSPAAAESDPTPVPPLPVVQAPPVSAKAPAPVFPVVSFKKKSDRLGEEARQIVDPVADYLRDHPDVTLWIEGHADARDSVDKNQALGEERAEAVARYLESLGIPAARLRTRSYGETRPAAAGHDRDARKANNRVEFSLAR